MLIKFVAELPYLSHWQRTEVTVSPARSFMLWLVCLEPVTRLPHAGWEAL